MCWLAGLVENHLLNPTPTTLHPKSYTIQVLLNIKISACESSNIYIFYFMTLAGMFTVYDNITYEDSSFINCSAFTKTSSVLHSYPTEALVVNKFSDSGQKLHIKC